MKRENKRRNSRKTMSCLELQTFIRCFIHKAVSLVQGRATASRLAVKQCARPSALNIRFHANVGRCPTLVCVRPSALGLRYRAESPTGNSVGQRPTSGDAPVSKPCKGASKTPTPFQGFTSFVPSFVGRCPTLLPVALSGLERKEFNK